MKFLQYFLFSMLIITRTEQLKTSDNQALQYSEEGVQRRLAIYTHYSLEDFRKTVEAAHNLYGTSAQTKLDSAEALRRRIAEEELQSAAHILSSLNVTEFKRTIFYPEG